VIGPEFPSHLGVVAPLAKLSSFARWLPAHAALVKSITVEFKAMCRPDRSDSMSVDSFIGIAQQLMQPAMALAAAHEAVPAAAPAAHNAPLLQQQQQQRGLRLVSFSGDLPGMPGLLAALPAHSLTRLDLDLWPSAAMSSLRLAAALAGLSSLQHLSLQKTQGRAPGIPTSCLGAVGQLSRLTYLKLAGLWSGTAQPLQQLLALPLPLQQLHLDLNMPLPKLDLAHLSSLRELSVKLAWSISIGSALPRQLQRLDLFYATDSTFNAIGTNDDPLASL
jgi:hypothetical protein